MDIRSDSRTWFVSLDFASIYTQKDSEANSVSEYLLYNGRVHWLREFLSSRPNEAEDREDSVSAESGARCRVGRTRCLSTSVLYLLGSIAFNSALLNMFWVAFVLFTSDICITQTLRKPFDKWQIYDLIASHHRSIDAMYWGASGTVPRWPPWRLTALMCTCLRCVWAPCFLLSVPVHLGMIPSICYLKTTLSFGEKRSEGRVFGSVPCVGTQHPVYFNWTSWGKLKTCLANVFRWP